MSGHFKVLLFGANGQVGSECQIQLRQQGWEVLALTRTDADFSQPSSVYEAIIERDPDIVVNACAYTAVDKAEADTEVAQAVNASSVAVIAKACAELNIPTIHISTDYVFSGEATEPYDENDAVEPAGVYGKTKLQGEQHLQQINPQRIICGQ